MNHVTARDRTLKFKNMSHLTTQLTFRLSSLGTFLRLKVLWNKNGMNLLAQSSKH